MVEKRQSIRHARTRGIGERQGNFITIEHIVAFPVQFQPEASAFC